MNQERLTSVEIQAVTVDDAIRLALEQLGLNESQVDIEILVDAGQEEDEEALVRVTARGMASQPAVTTSTPHQQRRSPGPRRAPGDRPSQRAAEPREEKPFHRVIDPNRVDSAEELVVTTIVRELLEQMRIDGEVMAVDNPSAMASSPDDAPTIFIDVLGRDLGMLIGRRGDHLAQFQYMINLIANRRIGEWSRVVVDIEGYRTRREESLIGLADRVARQVARSGRPIVLEPMPPNERRIIHIMLRDHQDVTTESSGEGFDRRITVQPRS